MMGFEGGLGVGEEGLQSGARAKGVGTLDSGGWAAGERCDAMRCGAVR